MIVDLSVLKDNKFQTIEILPDTSKTFLKNYKSNIESDDVYTAITSNDSINSAFMKVEAGIDALKKKNAVSVLDKEATSMNENVIMDSTKYAIYISSTGCSVTLTESYESYYRYIFEFCTSSNIINDGKDAGFENIFPSIIVKPNAFTYCELPPIDIGAVNHNTVVSLPNGKDINIRYDSSAFFMKLVSSNTAIPLIDIYKIL